MVAPGERKPDPLRFLSGRKNILILTHKNADMDALGSAILVCEAFPGKIVCPVGPSRQAAQAAEKMGVQLFESVAPGEEKFDATVVVDTGDPGQIEPFALSALPRPIIFFDHHSPREIPEADCVISEPLPSCAEVVLNFISPVTRRARVAALAGIFSDTKNLAMARMPTLRRVMELAIDDDCFAEAKDLVAYGRPEYSQRVATIKAVTGAKFEKLPDETILAWTRAGSFESSVATSLVHMGADVALVATDRKDEVRISARASQRMRDRIHLGDAFQRIGGGGHAGAAIVNLPAGTPEDAALQQAATLIKEVLVGK